MDDRLCEGGERIMKETKPTAPPKPKKPRPKPKDREALPFVACKGIILFSAAAAKYAATLGKN